MCPIYMLYGMTYEQYWYASPYLVKTYKELHRLQSEKKNEELWLQGLYFYNAISTSLANAFGKSNHNYLEKPLDLYDKSEAEQKAEAEREKQKIIANLKAWKQAMEQKNGSISRST